MKWEVFAKIAQSIGGFSGKVRGMGIGLCRELREEKPGGRHEKTVSEPGC